MNAFSTNDCRNCLFLNKFIICSTNKSVSFGSMVIPFTLFLINSLFPPTLDAIIAVLQAIERDGKDASILDLDPSTPLEAQRKKLDEPAVPDKNAALKDLFSKRAAKLKENDKPNKTEALEALFAKRSAEMQPEGQTAPPLRTDPNYSKYFNMLKVGMPRETVMQALERDGKDASVIDMDPEQSYASQIKKDEEKKKEVEKDDSEPALKDEYAKFFKMLKVRLLLYLFMLFRYCSQTNSISLS